MRRLSVLLSLLALPLWCAAAAAQTLPEVDDAGPAATRPAPAASKPAPAAPQPAPAAIPVPTPAPAEVPLVAAAPEVPPTAEATPGMGMSIGPLDFGLHGYFRAPLRLSWRSRCGKAAMCDQPSSIHSPWLVDDDYFRSGFLYTRLQESDWSELYFSVGNKYLTGQVALMGSLFSDWAQPFLERQMGIAQAFLSFKWQADGPRLRFRLELRAGSFWDRFGWLENYDTYIFGRTHQMGGQVRMEFGGRDLRLVFLQGVGIHQEALDSNQGLTVLNYLHAGVRFRRLLEAGFYFLDAFTQDQRQLLELKDADMRIYGLDFRLEHPLTGRLYVAMSTIGATQAKYLSPAIEVMHAYGGRGLTENYLGTEKSENGTGALWNLAFEHHFSLRALLERARVGQVLHGRDAWLRWFGLVAYTNSKQVDPDPTVNRDGRLSFKWGSEIGGQLFSWLMLSLRYDRVIADRNDEASSFRILTPRLTVTTRFLQGAQVFLQYSRYFYGDRVTLRAGQVRQETAPDTDAFKIQAQLVF